MQEKINKNSCVFIWWNGIVYLYLSYRNLKQIKMKKTITYKATGLVLGNTWGGGRGAYATVPLQSDSKEELLVEANKLLVEGKLDNGMGFESLVGSVLSIRKETSIEVDGDEYTNVKFEIEVIGTLSEDEIDWLQTNVLENLVD